MCNLDSKEQFFLESLRLFDDSKWLYVHPNTQILVRHSLDSFPSEWKEILSQLDTRKLNEFVAKGSIEENLPSSLEEFLQKCKVASKLRNPVENSFPPNKQLPELFRKGLSMKKQKEILQLAELVHHQCRERDISTIVDFGCGLGYIDQLLHYWYDYKVIGLESKESNVQKARSRQKKFYSNSTNKVFYETCKISLDSVEEVEEMLERFDTSGKVCLLSLHGCGDLGTDTMKIFEKIQNLGLLILVSCCYHKMTVKESTKDSETFLNFPLSRTLRKAIEVSGLQTDEFLTRPFLRLACQEPADRWLGMGEEAHNQHSLCALSRAVLELFAFKNNLELRKLVRKGTRKSQCTSFRVYLEDSLDRYEFVSKSNPENVLRGINENLKRDVLSLWEENSDKLNLIEIFTGLQLLLQEPAESLVLYDRVCWLEEQSISAKIVPFMSDRTLSPRCYAIISHKT